MEILLVLIATIYVCLLIVAGKIIYTTYKKIFKEDKR